MKHGDMPLSALASLLGVDPLPYEKPQSSAVARYDYYDRGVLLYYKEKYVKPNGDKSFCFFDSDGKKGLNGARRVLYRVDQLRTALKHGKTIYITEGEKDVDTLVNLGFIATSSDSGASRPWGEEYLSEFTAGSHVVICPDFDGVGIQFATANAAALKSRGVNVKWLDLGYQITESHGKDISDWITEGHKPDEISRHITSEFRAVHPNFKLKKLCEFSLSPPDWLIHGLIEPDSLAMYYGPSNSGKSFHVLDMSLCVASGKDFHGRKTKKGPVIYLAGEGHKGIVKRTFAWCLHNGIDIDEQEWWLAERPFDMMSDSSVGDVIASIDHYSKSPPAMVVIDTLARNFGDGDENATKDMARVIRSADAIRIKYRCLVIIVHHSGHTEGRARGNSSLRGAMDFEYEVNQSGDTVTVVNKKIKDGEKPRPMAFEFVSVELGIENLASAVLKQVETLADKQEKKITGENQKKAFAVLEKLYDEQRKNIEASGIGSEPLVLIEDWREALKAEGFGRKEIMRAKTDLVKHMLVTINEPHIMIGDSMDGFLEANK
jgi:hypothetical protein